jgi:hypothetical protein
MKFTEDWSKKDNDKLRQLIKEKKTINEIISIIGLEKLKNNPKQKYVGKFSDFILNEIFSTPKKTLYSLYQNYSNIFKDKLNYTATFNTDSGEEYILNLIYVEDLNSPFPNEPMYNISFTIKNQYDLLDYLKYENETNKDELLEIISRLIFIITDIDNLIKNKYPNIIYIIGETDNLQKINIYRNIIKNSLNYKELKGKSSINLGKPVYYYWK